LSSAQTSADKTLKLLVRLGPTGSCSHKRAVEIAFATAGHSGLSVADLQAAQAGASDTANRPIAIKTILQGISPGFIPASSRPSQRIKPVIPGFLMATIGARRKKGRFGGSGLNAEAP
jgi:hypothetical protein